MIPATHNDAYVGFVADYSSFDMGADNEAFGMPSTETRQKRARKTQTSFPPARPRKTAAATTPYSGRPDTPKQAAVAAFHKSRPNFSPAIQPVSATSPRLESALTNTPKAVAPPPLQTQANRPFPATSSAVALPPSLSRLPNKNTGRKPGQVETQKAPATKHPAKTRPVSAVRFEPPRKKKLFIWCKDRFQPVEKTTPANIPKTQ